MQTHMFLRIGNKNWNIIEKYFRMDCLCSLSAKNNLLNVLCWFKLKAYFLLESSFITFRPLIRSLAVLFGTFTVENTNVSSANNLVLH